MRALLSCQVQDALSSIRRHVVCPRGTVSGQSQAVDMSVRNLYCEFVAPLKRPTCRQERQNTADHLHNSAWIASTPLKCLQFRVAGQGIRSWYCVWISCVQEPRDRIWSETRRGASVLTCVRSHGSYRHGRRRRRQRVGGWWWMCKEY